MPSLELSPEVHHIALDTIFHGIEHPVSTTDVPIHQYRGIKYASVPARFRPSKLFSSYPSVTDATRYGPICPQLKGVKSFEELMFGLSDDEIPKHPVLKQNEFECLNLNVTCPGGASPRSNLPVMVWIHGGADRGSGSSWAYDGGNLVRKSVLLGKPLILVTFNFRLGLFGFAAGPSLREDNKSVGENGVGNYGLRDQQKCLEWIHHYISDFGGDPHNITLFGESTGASDIICHLLSTANEARPMFHRAIIQSAVMEYNLPDVPSAGWQLNRLMSALRVGTVEQLRSVEADQLVKFGQTMRVVDDEVFLRPHWKDAFAPEDAHRHHHHVQDHQRLISSKTPPTPSSRRKHHASQSRSRPRPSASSHSGLPISATLRNLPPHLQPLIIGDCAGDSLLWATPISYWTASTVSRRLKAICQSVGKSSALQNAYDIFASPYSNDLESERENIDRILELANDARVAWPTECFSINSKVERGGRGVWRYVWDQDGPTRNAPHHAADLVYLFDNLPNFKKDQLGDELFPETFLYDDEAVDVPEAVASAESAHSDDAVKPSLGKRRRSGSVSNGEDGAFSNFGMATTDLDQLDIDLKSDTAVDPSDMWTLPLVDSYSYTKIRNTIQEKWIMFANGETPWNEEKVFVFGPEGETGERSGWIFDGRRRREVWKEVFEPLGMSLVMKVGAELCRGPPLR